ncbi:sensor histidine kinase [Paenibacillus harenae]|uniref:histidine kinase n=1 Tax=Paenibacillus harenae TaxID=306543 RepID=A0ABT9U0Z8_PAEHA|nr:sensor histidine kinase [Paenibacillus harenae]MDQ0112932.1 signal transduction histidine kinase [Paenibacillus harenae]
MNVMLLRMRSLLVAIPAIVTIINIDARTYAPYTAFALLALLFGKADTIMPKLAGPILIAELLFFAWFSFSYGGILYLLPFSTLIAAFRRRPAMRECAAWTIAGCAALTMGLYGRDPELIVALLVLWGTASGLLYVTNDFENKRFKFEELYEALTVSNEQLDAARVRMKDYAAQIEQYAQSEERNRIAKDIHDDLGHRLIRVKMMSEAALRLFDVDTDRARNIVEQIRDQLQDSMERMRRTVRKLAAESDGEPRRYALDRLMAESVDGLGFEVRFEVQGIPRPIYPSMELILFKNAQEAITNAVRHGEATVVTVDLRFDSDSVSLTVANDGSLPIEPVEAGLGIRGMRERIALIGGKLEVTTEERFAITTTLPLLNK